MKKVNAHVYMVMPPEASPYRDKGFVYSMTHRVIRQDDGVYKMSFQSFYKKRDNPEVDLIFAADDTLHFKGVNTVHHFQIYGDWQKIKYYGDGWMAEGTVEMDDDFNEV